MAQETDPRTLHMPVKYPTAELYPQPKIDIFNVCNYPYLWDVIFQLIYFYAYGCFVCTHVCTP